MQYAKSRLIFVGIEKEQEKSVPSWILISENIKVSGSGLPWWLNQWLRIRLPVQETPVAFLI